MKKVTALLLVLLLVLTTGCGSSTGTDTSTNAATEAGSAAATEAGSQETTVKDSITLVNSSPIPDYDPLNWYVATQSALFCNVYSTLADVVISDDLQLSCRPNLAKSWEQEDDLTWVFHLNEKAVYSNGDKVTAEHVKTCFERHMTNPYTMSYVAMIESVEVRDENTVVFHLNYAWPGIPNCWYMVAIYNVDLYDADKEGYIKNPVGSGPYNLTALDETEGTMTLTLKDDWWGDQKPVVKTVNVRTITDMSTLVIALQKGEVDCGSLEGSNYTLVKDDPNLESKETISQVPYQLLVNKNVEPLNNDKLREAISYAIDYNAIRNVTCSGYVSSKDSNIVFATLERDLPSGVRQYEYNPEKAKELIAESGLATPIDVGEIIGGNNNGSAEMIQQYLAAVGINAKVTSYESNTFVQMLMGGQFSLGITTGSGGQSAFENLRNFYGTGQPYNFNKFSNARVDEIISELQVTTDDAKIDELLTEALNIIVDENTNMNLGIPGRFVVYQKGWNIPPIWNGVDMIAVH